MRSHAKNKVEGMAAILEPALEFQKSCGRSDKARVGGFFPSDRDALGLCSFKVSSRFQFIVKVYLGRMAGMEAIDVHQVLHIRSNQIASTFPCRLPTCMCQ